MSEKAIFYGWRVVAGLMLISCWLSLETSVLAAEDEEKKSGVRVIRGIQFNVPDDWPIEERGGSLGPIPIEEYVALKFGKVEDRFQKIETEVAQKLDRVGSRLQNLEQKVVAIDERLRDLERWLKDGEARS